MAKVNQLFQELVVRMNIVADGIEIRLFNENMKEQLLTKYNRQEILIEVDLAFKEIVTVKALGLEIQSRENIAALEIAARKLLENLNAVQSYAKEDLYKAQLRPQLKR